MPARIAVTTFADCERELIDRGGRVLLDRWHASPAVQATIRRFEHRAFHSVTLAELEAARRQVEDTGMAVRDFARMEPVPEIEDYNPEFPLVYFFHQLLEEHGRVPTFDEYQAHLSSAEQRAKAYEGFVSLIRALTHRAPDVAQRALTRRLAHAYNASFYELWTAAWLRDKAGIQTRYHLFADMQLQTDLWHGDTILCLRVPSVMLVRKKDPSIWATTFHIAQIDIARDGRPPLPT